MIETNTQLPQTEEQRGLELQRYAAMAEELSRNLEGFPFPGISEETLERLRAVDHEHPGLVTPVDTIIERMKKEGVRVVFGEDPKSGNVFVLPLLSENVENDSLFPRHLEIMPGMDETLRNLILANKASYASKPK